MASNTCSEFDEYRCCDCDISFSTAKLLSRHKGDITIHPPRAVPAHVEHNGNIEELSTYLSTVTLTRHTGPTTCPGIGCKRSFAKSHAMLTHIESGFCRSKINRELIDNIIIANDPTNIITNRAKVEERTQDRITLASSEYSDSINGSALFTPSELDSNFEEFDIDDLADDGGSEGTIVPRNRSKASNSGSDSDSDSPKAGAQLHRQLNTPSDSGESDVSIPRPRNSGQLYGNHFISSDDGQSGSYLQTPSDSEDGVYLTPSDSEDGVYLTPSDSMSGVYLTPSIPDDDTVYQSTPIGSGSVVFTQSTDSIVGPPPQPTSIKCPLCPATKAKNFANLEGLHTHLRSTVHQPKIYHCPFPDTPASGGEAPRKRKGKKRQKMKNFSSLSAMGQHVDTGACKNGEHRFEVTVAFLHEKLKEMGMADV